MKIYTEFAQNSLDWLMARAGIPTASEFSNLLTPQFKVRPWTTEMPNTYLARKVAEAWIAGPLPGYSSIDMEFGHILEDEAKPFYTLTHGQEITNVGFITTDDGRIGCSPDGLIGDDGGIEIKCPEPTNHVKYLLDGELPEQYRLQVHGSMFVTGRKWWKFFSYRRGFPPFLFHVDRDEALCERVGEALNLFEGKFRSAMAQIEEVNGGPPKRVVPEQPAPVLEPEYVDIIP